MGIQFVVSPTDYRDNIGHAVSIVKIFGNWYLCDDNIGFVQRIDITIEELVHSTIGYELEAGVLTYSIYDENKPDENNTRERELFKYIPTDTLINRSQSYQSMFEVSHTVTEPANQKKFLTRKYITWDPKGRAATTKYDYRVIPPPPRKLITWKNGNMTFQEYEDVLESKKLMEELALLAEKRRLEQLGNSGENAGRNSEGGRRMTRRRKRSTR